MKVNVKEPTIRVEDANGRTLAELQELVRQHNRPKPRRR